MLSIGSGKVMIRDLQCMQYQLQGLLLLPRVSIFELKLPAIIIIMMFIYIAAYVKYTFYACLHNCVR